MEEVKTEDVVNVPSALAPTKRVRSAKGDLVKKALENGTGAAIAFSTDKKELKQIADAAAKTSAKSVGLFAKDATLARAKALNEVVVNG